MLVVCSSLLTIVKISHTATLLSTRDCMTNGFANAGSCADVLLINDIFLGVLQSSGLVVGMWARLKSKANPRKTVTSRIP